MHIKYSFRKTHDSSNDNLIGKNMIRIAAFIYFSEMCNAELSYGVKLLHYLTTLFDTDCLPMPIIGAIANPAGAAVGGGGGGGWGPPGWP